MPPTKKYIFIDTCVLQASGDMKKAKSEAVLRCFSDFTTDGYSLAISEITLFENLQGLWGKKAQKVADAVKGFEMKTISTKVLVLAAMLQGLYVQEKRNDVDCGDKIIAATAILESGLVLTENHKDFPSPYFIMKKYVPITYLIDGRTNKTIDLGLYKPNYSLIGRKIEENDK